MAEMMSKNMWVERKKEESNDKTREPNFGLSGFRGRLSG